METVFSHERLVKMGWEELVAQCISACCQQDFDRAERIRNADVLAKIAQSSDRTEAEIESLPYLRRIDDAISVFFSD